MLQTALTIVPVFPLWCILHDQGPQADAGAVTIWVPPVKRSTLDEAVPPAEPGAVVVWTSSVKAYGRNVAPKRCCYRLPRVLDRNYEGERLMHGAILASRHARRTVRALYLPYMQETTEASAEESMPTIVDMSVDPSDEAVLKTRPPWFELDSASLSEALVPWAPIAAKVLTLVAWAWISGKLVRALHLMLACILVASSPILSALLTIDTWRAMLFVGKLSASKTWLAVLFLSDTWVRGLLLAKISVVSTWLAVVFLFKLAGRVGLAVLESDVVAAVLFLQAAGLTIWILATYNPGQEGTEQQQQVNTSSTPSPVQAVSPALPVPAPPAQTEASTAPSPMPTQTVSAPTHEEVAAVPTVEERNAHHKARLRRESGIRSYISAMRC